MVEEKVKKREWVKNAAIIFLSVMLVLTFFSNTFMNYSLPEVSTKYVESGSINAKIRGSGTVAAAETYEVTYDKARKVETICVKIGQQVAAGDVLFILESADNSEEVQNLRDQLEDAEMNYEIALLEAGMDSEGSAGREVAKARENLREAEARLERALGATNSKDYYEKALAAATAARDAAVAKINQSNPPVTPPTGDNSGTSEAPETSEPETKAGTAGDSATIIRYYGLLAEASYNSRNSSGTTQSAWIQAFGDYRDALLDEGVSEDNLPDVNGEFNGAVTNENYRKLFKAELDIIAAEKALANGSTSDSVEAARAAVEAAEDAYDAARERLSAENESAEINDKKESLQLKKAQREIDKLKEKINKLTSENDNEITAKTAGVISEINVAPGGMTGMGSPLAVLQLADRGFKTSFTVTNEQAKRLSVGDTAEVENYYWWGEEITAVLESIKTDPQSGGKSKILTFSVAGNVEPGTNLNLSLGQKSQNYDALVPNSAVRSDSNGSFVLVLETKSSPLNNRYVATRVDVKVLASDDVNSAVSGLSRGDYVITTASKPIESGTLVRMAEG